MISIPERLSLPQEGEKKSFDNFDFNLRCASPGIIMSFDPDTQTATVQIAITERIKCNADEFIAKYGANVASIEIPILPDVPVVYPCAGDFFLTFPVKAGNECLVVFSDACIDAWFQSGGVQDQMSLRRHDLSDAFAIVGVTSQPHKLTGWSTNSVQLRNKNKTNFVELSETELNMTFGANKIKIDASGITITGPVTLNNTLDVKGTTNLEAVTTIENHIFLDHKHLPGTGGNTGGVVIP